MPDNKRLIDYSDPERDAEYSRHWRVFWWGVVGLIPLALLCSAGLGFIPVIIYMCCWSAIYAGGD